MNPLLLIEENEELLYKIAFGIVIAYSVFGWFTLTGIKLNYGRLSNSMINFYINPKFAWFIFQIPNLLWAAYFILYKGQPISFGFTLFIIHYINRDLIYPLSLKTTTKVPFEIALNAFIFTLGNGFLQGSINLENSKTVDPVRQAFGTLVFAIGMMTNIHSDNILQKAKQRALKNAKQEQTLLNGQKSTKKHYSRIDDFLFKYISNPNYFGEIIEWIGYSIVCWNFQSFLFAFATFNVLVPAAIVRSRWNHQNITDYPKQRKAIIPFVL